jgi:hypothetical protein
MFSLRVPCKVCGEAASLWYVPVGFVHVECLQWSWFHQFHSGVPPECGCPVAEESVNPGGESVGKDIA